MLDVLGISCPIYITIALGFLTTRLGMFAKADLRVLGKFVLNLAMPALLFNALAQRNIAEILNVSYVLAYLSGTLLVVGLGLFWGRRIAKMSSTDSAVYAMGMTCSNSGFVGYPILMLTLPPVAGVVLALNMMVENVFVIPLLLALAEQGRGDAGHWHRVLAQSLARLASNPLIIGLVAGFAVSLVGWTLPEPLTRTVNLFALSSGALSLFVIGGTLVGLSMKGMGQRIAPISLGKLMLHPLAVLLAVWVLPLTDLPPMEPSLRIAAVLMAAMPMMSIYPVLAQPYGQESVSAAALLVTMVASFFTLSAMLWLAPQVTAWG